MPPFFAANLFGIVANEAILFKDPSLPPQSLVFLNELFFLLCIKSRLKICAAILIVRAPIFMNQVFSGGHHTAKEIYLLSVPLYQSNLPQENGLHRA
jgi:hypothetical protein